jgi:hypothetical protein
VAIPVEEKRQKNLSLKACYKIDLYQKEPVCARPKLRQREALFLLSVSHPYEWQPVRHLWAKSHTMRTDSAPHGHRVSTCARAASICGSQKSCPSPGTSQQPFRDVAAIHSRVEHARGVAVLECDQLAAGLSCPARVAATARASAVARVWVAMACMVIICASPFGRRSFAIRA